MALSAWMASARPVDAGLFIPGWPGRRGCDLLLTPDGAQLTVANLAMTLPYEGYADAGRDYWTVTDWATTQGGYSAGPGIRGVGRYVDPITQLRRQHHVFARFLGRIAGRSQMVPLNAGFVGTPQMTADTVVTDVLCHALALRPQWRPQLADPGCVTRLLRDLATKDHTQVVQKSGARRKTFELFLVLQQLRYQHPLQGRPLPDEPRPDPDVVVRTVLQTLASNRYALAPDEPWVEAMVHQHYLDVAPWPFAALTPSGSSERG